MLGLQRVEIRGVTENVRSRATPERLGFRQEGVLRRSGRAGDRYRDMVIYGTLKEEWEALNGQ